MRVSTKGRYALRIMVDLAENNGSFVPLKDIGERQNITVKYLEQIVSKLVKAELVKSIRGNGGGYMLARRPSEYRISDIFLATEGEFAVPAETENEWETEFWKGLEKAVASYFNNLTLEDVIKNGRASARRDPSIWIL